jgi:hypothetical protein
VRRLMVDHMRSAVRRTPAQPQVICGSSRCVDYTLGWDGAATGPTPP